MALTMEELETRLRGLETRNEQLERLVRLGRDGFGSRVDPAIALATDLVDLGQSPSCKMTQTTIQAIPADTWTPLTLQVISHDTMGDSADLANNLIIIRRGGLYLVVYKSSTASSASVIERIAGYSINNSTVVNHAMGNLSAVDFNVIINGVDLRALEVGDMIRPFSFVDENLNTVVTAERYYSSIAVLLVGETT